MKLIYLIAGTYRPAGMERVLANKTGWLASHGHDVFIVTTDQRGREPAFRFDERIGHYDLDINYEDNNGGSFLDKLVHYPWKQFKHRKRLTALLRELKPDVTVSMFCNDASFIPKIKDGSRKVLEIHFSRFKRLQYGRKGLWALADRFRSRMDEKVASRFDRFVVLTEEDRGYWGDLKNLCVIPNARTFICPSPATLDSKVVLAAGRYSYQKNFQDLVRAWSKIDPAVRKDWTLRIAGDGEDRETLKSLVSDPGLADQVVLGPSDDMKELYLNSSIYAMTSRYEGLPMVLLEAQAAGLPIVSYRCKCGPLDVVTDGKDGFLVEESDIDAFAASLERLMADDRRRRSMGAAAYSASERYNEEGIMQKWMNLFEGICQNAGQ